MKLIKFTAVLLVLCLILILMFYSQISRVLYTATGFSAKNICSGHFISGFSGQTIMEDALLPIDASFSYVDFNVDESAHSVTTHLLGLFSRKAVYNDGIGCTLLAIGDNQASFDVVRLPRLSKHQDQVWPTGELIEANQELVDYVLLNQSLDLAFEESNNRNSRRTNAVVVIRKGQLIAEKYAQGVDKNTPLLSWSMAKSITNMQVGILVKDGLIDLSAKANVPQWHMSDLPQDPRGEITLDQLMRMSSGLEFAEIYGIGSDAAAMLSIEPSAANFAADKLLIYQPDIHWAYSSGTSNIISAIIKRSIGGSFQNYYEFAQRRLFRPLGVDSVQLEADASGTFIGSSYMYATARDWAKLGLLFLQDGVWDGLRLLPEDWVKYSITATKTDPINHYGAQFWLNLEPKASLSQLNDGSKRAVKNVHRKWPSVPQDAYYMSGFQGQNVVMIPSQELVIVRLGYTSPGFDSGIESLISGVIQAVTLSK